MVFLASSLFIGAATAQTETPPWGDIEVIQVVKIHDCKVYVPKDDPEGGQIWTVCTSDLTATPSSQSSK